MHRTCPFLRQLLPAVLILVLVCAIIPGVSATFWGSGSEINRPVVNDISGPGSINLDDPSLVYRFTASVSGGSPPYTYTWLRGTDDVVFKGKEYQSVQLTTDQMRHSGPTDRYVYLIVTDSAGNDALWQREGGQGTTNEFAYGLKVDPETHDWVKVTSPKKFPTTIPTPAPTGPGVYDVFECKDSGTRFVGVTGQVEIYNVCKGSSEPIANPELGHGHNPIDSYYVKLAKLETVLFYEDQIKTDSDASAILGFSDMSTFVLKPDSHFVLAVPEKGRNLLKLVAGNIWINVKKMAQNGSMEIDMNQAAASIKGTTLVCSTDGKNDKIQVIEGTVEVTSKVDGKKVTITNGQQVTATTAGLGTPTTFDTAAVTADWDAVKAKTMAGKPAEETPAKKSAPQSAIIITALGLAVAGFAIRRM